MIATKDLTQEVFVDELSYPVLVFFPQYISPPLRKSSQMKSRFRDWYGEHMARSGRYKLLDSNGHLYRLSVEREFGMHGWLFRLLGVGYLAPVLIPVKSLNLLEFRNELISACQSRSKSDGGNDRLIGAMERIKDATTFRDAILCVPDVF